MEYAIYLDNKKIGEEFNIITAIEKIKTKQYKRIAEVMDLSTRKIVWKATIDPDTKKTVFGV